MAAKERSVTMDNRQVFLRHSSKVVVLFTLFLIFAGGMVTSTDSGLSVPDWPLSYGRFFPPMVGGVFYEHGHRMIATFVGLLILLQAIFLGWWEKRRWVKLLGFWTLGLVIIQGLFGGLTVILLLPVWTSSLHAIFGQTLLAFTIIVAYALSNERAAAVSGTFVSGRGRVVRGTLHMIGLIYVQLFFGAWMRHSGAGLAIPDFPTMGGSWLPLLNHSMLDRINEMRSLQLMGPVSMGQVHVHFAHRLVALALAISMALIFVRGWPVMRQDPILRKTLIILSVLFGVQIVLGMSVIWMQEQAHVTTTHVLVGATILGWSVLFLLRAAPKSWGEFKTALKG